MKKKSFYSTIQKVSGNNGSCSSLFLMLISYTLYGPLAHLARAPVLHSGGKRFESARVHKQNRPDRAIFLWNLSKTTACLACGLERSEPCPRTGRRDGVAENFWGPKIYPWLKSARVHSSRLRHHKGVFFFMAFLYFDFFCITVKYVHE